MIDEPFDGPDFSQNLEGGGFTVAGGVIRRDVVVNEVERRYIRTVESDYIHRDFIYELTLRTTPIGYIGIDYVGIGEGVGSGPFREPQNSVHFRIHSTNVGAGIVDVYKRETSNPMGTGTTVGNLLVDGTHRVRIEKAGDELTFSLDRSYDGTFSPDFTYTIPSISSYAPFLDHTNSHLFFGTAVAQHSFDDLRITFEPDRLVGGPGNIDDLLLQTMVSDTGPLTGARVVRVVQNAYYPLHFREIQAIESGTEMDVALSGTASQSSSPFPTLVASNVNNGNLDPRDVNHTAEGIGEWVEIELDGQKDLDQLILYNRTRCCQERATDVQVQVFADVAETDLLFDERVYGLDQPPYQKEVA
ncbi:MAG: discoidin domain-containing protein, partial [Candidatus Nealsonbacteria bacterium]|nr:discoidin domain-containing protein [Candidatus Nealsonbacteria bacterium]